MPASHDPDVQPQPPEDLEDQSEAQGGLSALELTEEPNADAREPRGLRLIAPLLHPSIPDHGANIGGGAHKLRAKRRRTRRGRGRGRGRH